MDSVFSLIASLILDDTKFTEGLNDAEQKSSNLGSGIAKALGVGATAVGAGIAVATKGVASLVTSSAEAYADYEQLAGGVETLFKDSADTVKKYADQAYQTAGLSANEYMETVTSFSASLLQSMGGDTEASAEKANQALVDMSDNANKMGSSMESIQNAYSGFAKGNYTMLDNLKLGYGGTASEMQRLIEDAEKLDASFVATRDENGDLTMSFGEIVDAIHVVQESMDIAGTTQKEASETISGSIGMVKGAWTNLIAGLGNDNADLSVLIDNLVVSAETALNNIVPVVEKALLGVADLVAEAVPIISDKLPDLVNDLLPKLLDSATTLFNGVVQALPTLIIILTNQAPTIIGNVADALIDNLPALIECAVQLTIAIATGLIKAIPKLVVEIPKIIKAIVQGLGKGVTEIAKVGGQLIEGLWDGISDKVSWITDKIKGFGDSVMSTIKGIFGIHSPSRVMKDEVGKMLALGLGEGFSDEFANVKKSIEGDIDLLDLDVDSVANKTAFNVVNRQNSEPLSINSYLYLEGDAKGLFRLVKQENEINTRMTGRNALVMA